LPVFFRCYLSCWTTSFPKTEFNGVGGLRTPGDDAAIAIALDEVIGTAPQAVRYSVARFRFEPAFPMRCWTGAAGGPGLLIYRAD